MIKAKAKTEKAAARQAAHAPLIAAMLLPPPQTAAPQAESANEDSTAAPTPTPGSAPALDRTELLRSKPDVVGRFMQLTVPILIDVYAASVNTPVRVKTLTGLLKAVSFLDAEGLKKVFTVSKTDLLFLGYHSYKYLLVRSRRKLCCINLVLSRSPNAGDRRSSIGGPAAEQGTFPVQAYIPQRGCIL